MRGEPKMNAHRGESIDAHETIAIARRLLGESQRNKALPLNVSDVTMARACLAAGLASDAVAVLADRVTDAPLKPPALEKIYRALLIDAGKLTEAGDRLWTSLPNDRRLTALTLKELLTLEALNLHKPDDSALQRVLDVAIAGHPAVVDTGHGVVYISIPKVACTALKATVIMNSPRRIAYEESGIGGDGDIHKFCGAEAKRNKELDESVVLPSARTFRFAVIREPMKRLVSAYLGKFVKAHGVSLSPGVNYNRNIAIRYGQAHAGIDADLNRSITFEEFVNFLKLAPNAHLDSHWMPQSRIIGKDLSVYDHVGKMEFLDKTWDVLAQRFSYRPETDMSRHLRGDTKHALTYNRQSTIETPQRLTPAVLRAAARSGGFPPPEAFLTPSIRDILAERYADDIRIYNTLDV